MLWFNLLNVTTNLVCLNGLETRNLDPADGSAWSLPMALLSLLGGTSAFPRLGLLRGSEVIETKEIMEEYMKEFAG